MSDKLVAGLVTAAVVGPICSVCILGPTFIFSWVSGLFAGLSPVVATGLAFIAVILAYGLLTRRKQYRRKQYSGSPICRESDLPLGDGQADR